MSQIHRTFTDEKGQIYRIVPVRWTWVITGLIAVQMLALVILLVIAVANRNRIATLTDRSEIQRQRNLATDEMLVHRARVQKWTYEQSCKFAESRGEKCLENPRWWADRNKYPALIADPDAQGSGLFPREVE